MSNDSKHLTAQIRDGIYTVSDAEGGVWWPNAHAHAEILDSDDPAATAVRICEQNPMRGEWHA